MVRRNTQKIRPGHLPSTSSPATPLVRDEFLDAHAVVNVSDVDGAIFTDGKVVAPINLAVVIAEAAPLGEDFAGEIELKELTTVGRTRLEVASVDYVKQIVGADGQRPGPAQFF